MLANLHHQRGLMGSCIDLMKGCDCHNGRLTAQGNFAARITRNTLNAVLVNVLKALNFSITNKTTFYGKIVQTSNKGTLSLPSKVFNNSIMTLSSKLQVFVHNTTSDNTFKIKSRCTDSPAYASWRYTTISIAQ